MKAMGSGMALELLESEKGHMWIWLVKSDASRVLQFSRSAL